MRKLVSIGAITLLPFLACTLSPVDTADSGSGTEITNGIVGQVVYSDGTYARGAKVIARKSDYIPDTLAAGSLAGAAGGEATTDEFGKFSIDSIDTGHYSIEVNDLLSHAVLLNCAFTATDSVVTIPLDTLRPTGAIRGVVAPNFVDPGPAFVFIYGLERATRTDPSNGIFSFTGMPAGSYSLGIAAIASPDTPKVVDGVNVTSSDTTILDTMDLSIEEGWAFSKKFVLNTSAAGANVAGTVTNFPLLVRLSAGNFNFSEAQADGADLRFAKADGTQFPYEIERWDPVAELAEIWVKIDTIRGNNSTQSLTMYWGNASATAASSGAAVFDNASGFQGVWHLADNAATPTVKDAVGKNDGTMKSWTDVMNTSATCTDGVVGKAVDFLGTGSFHWIDLGADKPFVNNMPQLSISLWMYADTYYGELFGFSKGNVTPLTNSASRISLSLTSDTLLLNVCPADNGTRAVLRSTQTYPRSAWHYIVGVANVARDSLYIYANGALWGATAFAFTEQTTDSTNSSYSAIGSNDRGNDLYFEGIIDEVRIENIARSPDWIALSYENQKQDGKLIQ